MFKSQAPSLENSILIQCTGTDEWIFKYYRQLKYCLEWSSSVGSFSWYVFKTESSVVHFWAYDELKSTKSLFYWFVLFAFYLRETFSFICNTSNKDNVWKRGNLYPWSVNGNRWEKLQSADFGNKHKGGVNRWQDTFWQKAVFGETLTCQTHLNKCFWRGAGRKLLETLGESKPFFFPGESSGVVENLENIFFSIIFCSTWKSWYEFI